MCGCPAAPRAPWNCLARCPWPRFASSSPRSSPKSIASSTTIAINEIADILNSRGWHTWESKPFNLKKIAFIRGAYKLPSRYERLRRRGMLTTREIAGRFDVSETAVHHWGRQGLIKRCYEDNLNRGLWEIPPGQTIRKGCGGRDARPARLEPITTSSTEQGAV